MKVRKQDQDGQSRDREAGISSQIREIEEELARTKYNKATQAHIGRLKAKLARLREQRQRAGLRSAGLGYGIKKEGDATVVLVGFPSVGKSTMLNRISNAESKVGEYDFTTLNIVPGMMELHGARIHVLDIPGVVDGASQGKGRGREVLSVVRNADLIVIILDAEMPEQLDPIRRELYLAGFRLDQERPDVRITKRPGGGLDIGSAVRLTRITREMVKDTLHEFKIFNAEVVIRQDIDIEQLTDCILGNRAYIPSLVVVNKADRVPEPGLKWLKERCGDCILISAERGSGIGELREAVWRKLGLMRIFMKRPGRQPDMKEPVIVRKGAAVRDVAKKIHRSWGRAHFARVWGSSRFPGQRLGLDYALRDGDVVEIHTE
jgi:ribosome-interacting GTPase 1